MILKSLQKFLKINVKICQNLHEYIFEAFIAHVFNRGCGRESYFLIQKYSHLFIEEFVLINLLLFFYNILLVSKTICKRQKYL